MKIRPFSTGEITFLLGVLASVLANFTYLLIIRLGTKWQPDYRISILLILSAMLIVSIWEAVRSRRALRHLGYLRIYAEAKETTEKGMREAKTSYSWLGTSSYYVICSPQTRESFIEGKPRVDFLFMTIDPECTAVVKDQAAWERRKEEEVVERIT